VEFLTDYFYYKKDNYRIGFTGTTSFNIYLNDKLIINKDLIPKQIVKAVSIALSNAWRSEFTENTMKNIYKDIISNLQEDKYCKLDYAKKQLI
jgi:hypothetical protein